MIRKRLYVDIDGVVNHWPVDDKNNINIRPMATEFLRWCDEHFNCCWLTAWKQSEADELSRSIYFKRSSTTMWRCVEWVINKAESINFAGDVIWIDDDPTDHDIEVFNEESRNAPHRQYLLIKANPHNVDELINIRMILEQLI